MRRLLPLFFVFTPAMAEMLPIIFHTGLGGPHQPLDADDLRSMNTSDLYFEQKLNHFSSQDERTWMQRYWENSTYYKSGGPVLLLISGEEAGDPSWMKYGTWHLYARDLNAMMFMLEHRYYGESRPTDDTSVENLEYLHVDQALADTVYFIDEMKRKYNDTKSAKWIAIGGSYAGNLAVWLRMKYPHLIHSTISSSAPLLAKLEYEEFLESIAQSILAKDEWCSKRLKLAYEELETMVQKEDGRIKLSKELSLCDWLSDREEDIAILYLSLVYNMAIQVQRNPNDENGYVKNLCDYMTNSSRWEKTTSSVQRYIEYMKVIFKLGVKSNVNCIPSNFNDYYRAYVAEDDWETADIYGKQWQYLTCSQLGYHQTSSKRSNMFGRRLPLKIFLKACKIMFGFSPNAQIKAIDRTNLFYGAFDNKVSRVIYVSGTVDPWYSLNIHDTDQNGYRPYRVIVVKGGGHCADMFSPSEKDSVSLKDAREQIRNTLRVWVNENT